MRAGLLLNGQRVAGRRKFWLCMTLITSLGVLFFFKYFNFLADSANSLWNFFGGSARDFSLDLIPACRYLFLYLSGRFRMSSMFIGKHPGREAFRMVCPVCFVLSAACAGPDRASRKFASAVKEDHKLEASNAFFGLQKMAIGFFRKLWLPIFWRNLSILYSTTRRMRQGSASSRRHAVRRADILRFFPDIRISPSAVRESWASD